MDKLMQEFKVGFSEGWGSFWAPFVGLAASLRSTWRKHVGASARKTTHKHA